MAKTIADLQQILFDEIDNVINVTKGHTHEKEIRLAVSRSQAVNESANTIIKAGELILQSMIEAGKANSMGAPMNQAVVNKLIGVDDESPEGNIRISHSE